MFIISGHGGEVAACLEVDTLDDAIKEVEKKWDATCIKRTLYADDDGQYSVNDFDAPRPHWVCHFRGGGCSVKNDDGSIDDDDYCSFVLYPLKVGWVD